MKICFLITTRGNIAKTESIREHLEGRAELFFIVGGGVDINRLDESNQRQITVINEGTLRGTYKSAGIIAMEVGTILEELKPDMMVIVADRFECLPVAMIAAYMNIPIAHIEGGEISGSIDESIRHAITKLAHLHFPCTERAKNRIIRLGENPDSVFNFGSTSIDMMERFKGEKLNVPLSKLPYIVVCYHPISSQIEDIGCVIEAVSGFTCLWIAPNIDTHSYIIRKRLLDRFYVQKFYPIKEYTPLIKYASCIVGNSSSGIRDAPFFGTPSVNIGDRQNGRKKPDSVMDVPVDRKTIIQAIDCRINRRFEPDYIYGDGHAGKKIADKILTHKVDIQKVFYDLGNYTSKSG